MIYKCPEYALKFKCKAGACSDSCCVGWEIGVDERTRAYYMNAAGAVCEKVKSSLISDGDFCFIGLLENGRCPMLDSGNLCEIIRELGDSHIPEICREHPRFYNPLPRWTEWGIGLSCEEAARLILTDGRRDILISDENEDAEDCKSDKALDFLLFSRERIFELINLSPLPFFEKAHSLVLYGHALADSAERGEFGILYPFIPLNNRDFHDTGAVSAANGAYSQIIYGICEIDFLDVEFENRMLAAAKSISSSGYSEPSREAEKMLDSLLHYFIYRYFITAEPGYDICAKVKLALVLTLTVHALVKNSTDLEDWISAAKSLSKEIDYNEENLDLVSDMIFTEQAFSTENLIKILSCGKRRTE